MKKAFGQYSDFEAEKGKGQIKSKGIECTKNFGEEEK